MTRLLGYGSGGNGGGSGRRPSDGDGGVPFCRKFEEQFTHMRDKQTFLLSHITL